jgi:hypothetical protein
MCDFSGGALQHRTAAINICEKGRNIVEKGSREWRENNAGMVQEIPDRVHCQRRSSQSSHRAVILRPQQTAPISGLSPNGRGKA